ncbi:MAG: protein kinase [Myxococcota bacterium]
MTDITQPERSSVRVQQAASEGPRRLVRAVLPKLALALVLVLALDVGVGLWIHARVQAGISQRLSSSLRALLDTHVQALKTWHEAQLKVLDAVLRDDELQSSARALLQLTPPPDADARREALRARLAVIAPFRPRFTLTTPDGVVVASTAYPLGQPVPPGMLEQLRTAPRAERLVLPPFRVDEQRLEAAALGRINGAAGLAGFLFLHLDADAWGGTLARGGALLETGEVLAFNRDGVMLSHSRFTGPMRGAGVLGPDDESAMLKVALKDPGVDLTKGGRPKDSFTRLPLTAMAQAATRGESGEDLTGYRNALGLPVVGVWRWLEDQGVGVAVELGVAEAYAAQRVVSPLLTTVLTVLGLLGFTGAALLVLWREESRRAKALGEKARVLGQYELAAKLGEGGMGVVYEAKHALLHRRAAIKLMQPGRFTPTQLARFEREVQVTAALSHPNTIAIYDYGRADDGTFYYVMELLDGCDLHDVVRKTGVLSSPRVAFIMKQVCGSLAEAHAQGLVHRDIKPSNIFLSQRAGLYDFPKLLDFGLVKAGSHAPSGSANLTAVNALLGTPAFMAPELFDSAENASPRSDLYAVGCVIYWALTGRPLFEAFITSELAEAHRKQTVRSPSEVSGQPVDPALEALVIKCLAKRPEERPQSVEEVVAALERVQGRWTQADAKQWWHDHGAALGQASVDVLPATLSASSGGDFGVGKSVTRVDR